MMKKMIKEEAAKKSGRMKKKFYKRVWVVWSSAGNTTRGPMGLQGRWRTTELGLKYTGPCWTTLHGDQACCIDLREREGNKER